MAVDKWHGIITALGVALTGSAGIAWQDASVDVDRLERAQQAHVSTLEMIAANYLSERDSWKDLAQSCAVSDRARSRQVGRIGTHADDLLEGLGVLDQVQDTAEGFRR